jgi:hypothetical protein
VCSYPDPPLLLDALQVLAEEVLGAEYMLLHSLPEAFPVAAYGAPRLVEGVVTVVVAVGVGGVRPPVSTAIASIATDGKTIWNGQDSNSSTTSSN